MWFGIGHTCAKSQSSEADHPSGRGYGDDFFEVHSAPLVQLLTPAMLLFAHSHFKRIATGEYGRVGRTSQIYE